MISALARWPALRLVAVLVAVTATYANSFANAFHFDDFHSITDNAAIRSLKNVPRFFVDATTSSVLPANQTYRPVVTASLALDYAIGHGYVTTFFHLTTFAVFLACLAAIYGLFAEIGRRADAHCNPSTVALFAMALFGLHPAIAETVNYIIQRADIYSTFGVVLALLAFARHPQLRRTQLYLVPAAFGMLSKPPAVVFPLLLFAYVWFFEEDLARVRIGAALRSTMPAFALSLGALALYHVMLPKTFVPTTLSTATYIVAQPYVLLRDAITLLLPLNLSVDSDLAPLAPFSQDVLIGDVFLIGTIAGAAALARKRALRPIAFGIMWFLIAALPTAVFPLAELENDHRLFFPFIGGTFAFAWTAAVLLRHYLGARERQTTVIVACAAIALLGACAAGTSARNTVWRSERSLWADAAAKSPHNGRALMNYGLVFLEAGNYATASNLFAKAALLTPNYPALEINQGLAAAGMREQGVSEAHFRRAIALAPGDDQPHFFYARWLRDDGQLARSIAEAESAVRLNPASVSDRTLAMQDEADAGHAARARSIATGTLVLDPNDSNARAELGDIGLTGPENDLAASSRAYSERQYGACVADAKLALVLRPRYAAAYNNIGACEPNLAHWREAIAADRMAVALDPTMALARNNLAWALAHAPRRR